MTERADRLELVLVELQAAEVEVLALAVGIGGPRDGEAAELLVPAQDHLGGGHLVAACRVDDGSRFQGVRSPSPSGLQHWVWIPR